MANERYIGLMSGTSMDGVDAVLIHMNGMRFGGASAHAFLPFPKPLRAQLMGLQVPQHNELATAALLSQELSRLYAQVVDMLLRQTQLSVAQIAAIGCHGQTVRHAPSEGYTIQLGNLALLSELTQCRVIGDFRSQDVAAGGQGAPLVPAFHQAVFGGDVPVAILNLGGIANITVLRPGSAPAGWDTGPANMLLDAWTRRHFNQDFDESGELARSGSLNAALCEKMLDDAYFHRLPPKSTGRDYFNGAWLTQQLNGRETASEVLRTLLECTAISAAQAVPNECSRVYVCGGGAMNAFLMERLRAHLGARALLRTEALGLPSQWVEAAAFAWLAAARVNHAPASVPEVTGARGARILGASYCYE